MIVCKIVNFRRAGLCLPLLFCAVGCASLRPISVPGWAPGQAAPALQLDAAGQAGLAALRDRCIGLAPVADSANLQAEINAFFTARPSAWQAMDELANLLYDRGRAEMARGLWEQALQIRPNAADLHNSLGVCLGHEGRMLAAIDRFRTAIELAPLEPEYHFNLATMYFTARHELRQRENWSLPEVFWKSQAAYERAFQLAPDNFDYARNCFQNYIMARYFEISDVTDLELAACRRCLDLRLNRQQQGLVYTHLARLHLHRGERRQAMEWIHRAIHAHDTPMARTVLGNIEKMPQ